MLMIPMDEAGAFDLLSILQIKYHKKLPVGDALRRFHETIEIQIGDRINEIKASDEFEALINSNRKMWDIQEQAMRDACKASDVDRQNQARYWAKSALQKKFFNSELTEKKTVRPYESIERFKGSNRFDELVSKEAVTGLNESEKLEIEALLKNRDAGELK